MSPEAAELYNRGCEALTKGDAKTAAGFFRQAVAVAPDMSDARFNLACSLQAIGDLAGAMADFRKCLATCPDDLASAFNLGCLLEQTGDMAGAVALFGKCIAIDASHQPSLFNLALALTRLGDRAGAIEAYRTCMAINPANVGACRNLASLLAELGDDAAAIEVYQRCLVAAPESLEPAYNLASLLMGRHRYDEATRLLADLDRRFARNEKILQNLALARWRGRVASAASRERDAQAIRLLVACMPKSGSTYLADVLSRLPGMQRVHLVPAYGRREQELDLEQLINHVGISYVSQLHLRPSKLTQELTKAFGLKTVFLYRNIWDVMASLRDHMHSNSLDWSMAQIDPEFRSWDEGRQYVFLAWAMMPWFIDFYVSWSREGDKLAVSYEELMADPAAVIGRIAGWAGITASGEEIARALAETGHSATFNKGGSGRGKAVPTSARAHVEALAGFYPEVDFTPLFGSVGQANR